MELTETERRLLNDYQHGFPLEPRPYARIAAALHMSEKDVLTLLGSLEAQDVVTRVGAVVRPNTAGASTLAAMAVPPERIEEVANFVSRQREVNHNYEREHAINLWFVVTASDAPAVGRVLKRIAEGTGLKVLDLPLTESFHIDLGFDLT